MPILLPKITQQTDSHCGPAVVEMLLRHQGIYCTQYEITKAAGASDTILDRGTRPFQLAQAVTILAPHMQLWFKQHATISDLYRLIHEFQQPVAVNWQGLFYDSLAEEAEDFPEENIYGDHGHYSVVTSIDLTRDLITLADPYPDYAGSPRQFSLRWFMSRWWDYAKDLNPATGTYETIRPDRFMFIIVSKEVSFPEYIDMRPAEELSLLKTASDARPDYYHTPGQKAAIRPFNPESNRDYHTLKAILDNQEVKHWMVNVNDMSYDDYVDWVNTVVNESILYAVLNTSNEQVIDANQIHGFVYLYSGQDERSRFDRLSAQGIVNLPPGHKNILEVSFARHQGSNNQPVIPGLISSALRQACQQTRTFVDNPYLFAFIDQDNLAARRTVESSGFVQKGMMKYDIDSPTEDCVYLLDWRELNRKLST